jgi:hypothetical protein
MFHRATNPMALRDFRASLHGELILPDDDGYDSARRVWNRHLEIREEGDTLEGKF